MSGTIPKWTDERTASLVELVGSESPVSVNTVSTLADTLETSTRSISSKLRKLGYDVESLASVSVSRFTEAETEEVLAFVESYPGEYTYAEVAANVCGGKFDAKQIQGKVLSLEKTGNIKPTPKVEVAKTYSDEEEATLIKLAKSGAFLEDIAAALDRDIKSVRGKCLSLRAVIDIPKQRESHAQSVSDPIEALGDLSKLTVAEIATAVDKSERGIKVMLTRRGLSCKDHDGEAKAAKILAKKTA